MGVLDFWMLVQAKHAVTTADLANSLKVVGNAAIEVGVDLYDLAANVSAIATVTRKTGNEVAQSLKTMFARFARPESQGAFFELGIPVKESMNTLRDFDDVLADLFVKWDTLTNVQRQNLAYTVGGVRRYADFIALMENYGEKLQVVSEAYLAQGSAARAMDIEMASLKKTLDRGSAALKIVGAEAGATILGQGSSYGWAITRFSDMVKGSQAFATAMGKASGATSVFVVTLAGLFMIRTLNRMTTEYSRTLAAEAYAAKLSATATNMKTDALVAYALQLKSMGGVGTIPTIALMNPVSAAQFTPGELREDIDATATSLGKAEYKAKGLGGTLKSVFAGGLASFGTWMVYFLLLWLR
jgi:hypothetical protein